MATPSSATPSTPGPIPSAISAALKSNMALQTELKRRLLKIRRAQVQNRRNAASVTASLSHCSCWSDDPDYSLGGETTDSISAPTKKDTDKSCNNADAEDDPCEEELNSMKVARELSSKKWACNTTRKQIRGFFVDPDGSTPGIALKKLCSDANEVATGQLTRVIFEQRKTPPASLKEPEKSWEEVRGKKCLHDKVDITLSNDSSTPAEDGPIAHFTFADASIAKTKFTKQECLSIMSMISKQREELGDIDWHELALEHHKKFNKQTPWSIFCHYRSTLQNPVARCTPWSPEEDELLLKYLAVHGPQYFLQGHSLDQLCKNIFPQRNIKQISQRAQSTLINPNYTHDDWDSDEKRKLALLMRIYSNEPHPINCASRNVHFPHRAPKGVYEKWIKTLDPALSHRPMTQNEDMGLKSSGKWSQDVLKKFPNRSRDTLKRRWAEVADESAVTAHCESKMISKKLAIKGGGELGPDDFLVRPQLKQTRSRRKIRNANKDKSSELT